MISSWVRSFSKLAGGYRDWLLRGCLINNRTMQCATQQCLIIIQEMDTKNKIELKK